MDFVVAEVRVEREREDLGGGALCGGERGVWLSVREEWLLVEQVGVVNERLDAAVGEVSAEAVAVGVADDVEVVDVRKRAAVRIVDILGGRGDGSVGEGFVVALGDLHAAAVPVFEAFELDAEHGGLRFVEARVEARDLAAERRRVSALSQGLDAFDEFFVVRRDGAAVAVGAEVFRRVETEGRGEAESAREFAAVGRAVRLRRVFEDEEVAARGDFVDAADVGGLAVEVDGDDGARARRDGRFERGGVERERVGVYVGEDGDGARVEDGERGVGGGQRRGDDFVARAGAHRAGGEERERDGVRAVADARREARAAEARPLLFKRRDLGAEDVRAAAEHAPERFVRLRPDLFKLSPKVEKGYPHPDSSSARRAACRTRRCAPALRAKACAGATRAPPRSCRSSNSCCRCR